MMVTTANTVALDREEVRIALAVRVPLAEIPQTLRGNYLELQFRDRRERDEWIAYLENAYGTYREQSIPLAGLAAQRPAVPSPDFQAHPKPRSLRFAAICFFTALVLVSLLIWGQFFP